MTASSSSAIAADTLGAGMDSLTGDKRSSAVDCRVSNAHSGRLEATYKICTSTHKLHEQIHAEASVGLNWGAGHAEAKATYVESLNVDDNCISIGVYGSTSKTYEALNCTLKKEVVLQGNAHVYGDSFVSKVVLGAEVSACFVARATSSRHKLQIEAELKAEGITKIGKLSASFSASLRRVEKKCSTTFVYKAYVAGVSGLESPAADNLSSFVLKFTARQADCPVILELYHTQYTTLPNVTSKPHVIENARIVTALEKAVKKMQTCRKNIKQVQKECASYGVEDERVESRLVTVETDIRMANSQLRNMARDRETHVFEDPTRKYLSLDFGTAVVCKGQPGPAGCNGGRGGDRFADVDSNDTVLSSFHCASGAWIDLISPGYTTNGQETIVSHGGGGGRGDNKGRRVIFARDEYIIRIEGRTEPPHNLIKYLEFHTTAGREVSFGNNRGGNRFTWRVPKNKFVVGFAGRSGEYLDAIEPLCCSLDVAWDDSASSDGYTRERKKAIQAMEHGVAVPVPPKTAKVSSSTKWQGTSSPTPKASARKASAPKGKASVPRGKTSAAAPKTKATTAAARSNSSAPKRAPAPAPTSRKSESTSAGSASASAAPSASASGAGARSVSYDSRSRDSSEYSDSSGSGYGSYHSYHSGSISPY